jgi:hypothetical protein
MQLAKHIRRWWRRATVAGVDTVLDFEVAAIQAILKDISADNRMKLLHQIARYDRVDRAPNRRKQRFVDDDSDFHRSNWPRDIFFVVGDTEHIATVKLQHCEIPNATIRAKAFLIWGWFDGFEFDLDNTHGLNFDAYAMSDVMPSIEKIATKWQPVRVELLGSLRAKAS